MIYANEAWYQQGGLQTVVWVDRRKPWSTEYGQMQYRDLGKRHFLLPSLRFDMLCKLASNSLLCFYFHLKSVRFDWWHMGNVCNRNNGGSFLNAPFVLLLFLACWLHASGQELNLGWGGWPPQVSSSYSRRSLGMNLLYMVFQLCQLASSSSITIVILSFRQVGNYFKTLTQAQFV